MLYNEIHVNVAGADLDVWGGGGGSFSDSSESHKKLWENFNRLACGSFSLAFWVRRFSGLFDSLGVADQIIALQIVAGWSLLCPACSGLNLATFAAWTAPCLRCEAMRSVSRTLRILARSAAEFAVSS